MLYKDWLTRYQHIERLGHEDCEGLLEGEVVVQEKLDGANLTVAWDLEAGDNGDIVIASRNRVISVRGSQGGDGPLGRAVTYVLEHPGFRALFRKKPLWVLRGEWLAPHSITYDKDWCWKLVVFDVQERPELGYVHWRKYADVLTRHEIPWVPALATLFNPSVVDVTQLAEGRSGYGDVQREGIVVKNYGFRNQHGRATWGKCVTADFREKHRVAHGATRHDPAEVAFAARCTEELVHKEMRKIQADVLLKDGVFDVRQMPRIIGTMWHVMFHEELWGFLKRNKRAANEGFVFREARRLVEARTREVALRVFNGVEEL